MKRILVASSKGGGGKSTLTRNLAVAAAADGLQVAMLDFDIQRTLTAWYGRRPEGIAEIAHFEARMSVDDVTEAMGIEGFDVLIIDTPPSIEDHPEEFRILMRAADFVLIPTGQTADDLHSVQPWMAHVRSTGAKAAFVLNRVKPRTKSFVDARNRLARVGPLCPVELPDFEDVPATSELGLGLLELKRAKGADHLSSIWAFVREQAGV